MVSHVWNNYDPQGVFKDHRRDRYGQLVIGIVTRRPRIVFPTWEVHRISSETMNSWNSVRGFHGMPCVREILGLRGIGGRGGRGGNFRNNHWSIIEGISFQFAKFEDICLLIRK